MGLRRWASTTPTTPPRWGFTQATWRGQAFWHWGATNAVPNLAPVGGKTPIIGTNPIFPMRFPPRAARSPFWSTNPRLRSPGRPVKRAAEAGEPIPLGWALDAEGAPTTDAEAGLAGSMAPAGGVKGFSIGLLVEVLCAALAGGKLGPDQGSFTDDDGTPIDNGQFFVAFDPGKPSGGGFDQTITKLVTSITEQDGARLPNARREANNRQLAKQGIPIESELYETLKGFA